MGVWIGLILDGFLGMGTGMGNTLRCNVSQEFGGLRVGTWRGAFFFGTGTAGETRG